MKNLTFSEFKKNSLKEWKERNLISDEIIFKLPKQPAIFLIGK